MILRDLAVHADDRGALQEVYRADWTPSDPFFQWNLVRSRGNVLRGVHVHPRHCDYLHVIDGEMPVGIHDLRPEDPAERRSGFVSMTGDRPQTLYLPAGVCHGFWFAQRTVYVYGLSVTWAMSEELGCRYDDPALGLDWPAATPLLAPRDAAPALDYSAMREAWIAMTRRCAAE